MTPLGIDPVEALTQALALALTAPSDEKMKECVEIAELIAQQHSLTDDDVAAAKQRCLDALEVGQ